MLLTPQRDRHKHHHSEGVRHDAFAIREGGADPRLVDWSRCSAREGDWLDHHVVSAAAFGPGGDYLLLGGVSVDLLKDEFRKSRGAGDRTEDPVDDQENIHWPFSSSFADDAKCAQGARRGGSTRTREVQA